MSIKEVGLDADSLRSFHDFAHNISSFGAFDITIEDDPWSTFVSDDSTAEGIVPVRGT